jgi:hypothetical protein
MLNEHATTETTTETGGRLERLVSWLACNIAFFSSGRHWKGVYLHVFPSRCHRLYWAHGELKHDSHPKAKYWGAA